MTERIKKERPPRSVLTCKNAPTWWDPAVDAAWKEKNRKEKEFEQHRVTSNAEAFTKLRIERNHAASRFKQTAARTIRAQWDRLCSKANLNTMEFWKFHNKLKAQRSLGRTILYSDSGKVLHTDEEQGKAFLARLIRQSNHNDQDCRTML